MYIEINVKTVDKNYSFLPKHQFGLNYLSVLKDIKFRVMLYTVAEINYYDR